MIELGHGKAAKRSDVQAWADEHKISFDRAREELEDFATLQAAAEEIKRNPTKYGVREP